jgi:sec-independent protein translocase protein TatA
MTSLFGIMGLGPAEIIVIAVIGVLLFGRRLPEVGRYLGKGIVEFKKGIKGLEDEVDSGPAAVRHETAAPDQIRAPQRIAATAPKFEDAPAAPAPNPAANPHISTPPRG